MMRSVLVSCFVAIAMLGTGCSSDPTQSDEYGQLESAKANVGAQLADAQSELASLEEAATEAETALEEDRDALRTDVARLESQLSDAEVAAVTASEALARLTKVIETDVAFGVFVTDEDFEEAEALGVTSEGDWIVESRGWATSWEQFVKVRGGFTMDRLVAEVDDRPLEDAWFVFQNAPVGSDEEAAALHTFYNRLYQLILEGVDETTLLMATEGRPR